MANNIETVFTAQTDQFENNVRKAANTLKSETGRMFDALKSAGGGMDALNEATKRLAAAQMQASAEFRAAKLAYQQGAIGLEEYRRQQLETRTALGLVRTEHSRMVSELRRGASDMSASRAGMQNLGFQLQDVAVQFAGGTSAARIFAQQGPQIVSAVASMSGSTGRFAAFMQGPWGAAMGVGVAVLGALAVKLLGADDANKKAEQSTRSFADVLRDSKASWVEVGKAAKDYADQLQKNRTVTIQTIIDENALIAKRYDSAKATREKLQAELDLRYELMRGAATPLGDPLNPGAPTDFGTTAIEKKRAENKQAIADLNRTAAELRIKTADTIAQMNSDPQAKIKAGFDLLRDSARRTITDVDALAKRLTDLNRQEATALKAMQEASRKTGPGNPLSVGPSDVARILGVTPTSGTRSAARNKAVGGDEDSFHLSGQAIDFPLGKWSKELIRSTLERAGIRILELLGPGDKGHSDHFHVAFAKTRRDPESVGEALAREQERAREESIRRQRDFEAASASIDKALLDAKQGAVTDAATLAKLAKDEIRVESDKFRSALDAKVALGDLTKAQRDELAIKNAILSVMRTQQVDLAEARRQSDEAFRLEMAANDNQKTLLGLQENLAQTAAERRGIQLRILDIEKAEERRALERQRDDETLAAGTREQARRKLAQLDQEYGLRAQSVTQGTRGPLERYLADMDPARTGERVESLMVAELESVREGINSAITQALGVKDPLLAGIIDMFIQTVLIQPIANALRQAQMSAGGGGGLLGGLLSIGGSLLGGGGAAINGVTGAQFAAGIGSSVSNWTAAVPTLLAGGGPVIGPGGPTTDSILARLSNGEFVMNAAAVRRIGAVNLAAMNDGRHPRFASGGLVGRLPALMGARHDNGGPAWARPIEAHFHFAGGMSERDQRETVGQAMRALRTEQGRQVRMGG